MVLLSGLQGQMNMAGAPPLSSVCKIHQILQDKRPTVSQTAKNISSLLTDSVHERWKIISALLYCNVL